MSFISTSSVYIMLKLLVAALLATSVSCLVKRDMASEADIKAILDAHNEHRQKHGAEPVVWDAELAADGYDWSTKCELRHSAVSDIHALKETKLTLHRDHTERILLVVPTTGSTLLILGTMKLRTMISTVLDLIPIPVTLPKSYGKIPRRLVVVWLTVTTSKVSSMFVSMNLEVMSCWVVVAILLSSTKPTLHQLKKKGTSHISY